MIAEISETQFDHQGFSLYHLTLLEEVENVEETLSHMDSAHLAYGLEEVFH